MFPVSMQRPYNFRDTFTQNFSRGARVPTRMKARSASALGGQLQHGHRVAAARQYLVRPVVQGRSGGRAGPARFSFDLGSDSFVKLSGHSFAVCHAVVAQPAPQLRYDRGSACGRVILPGWNAFFAAVTHRTRIRSRPPADRNCVRAIAPGVFGVRYQPVGAICGSCRTSICSSPSCVLVRSVFLDSGVVAFSFDGLSASPFATGSVRALCLQLPIGDLSLAFAIPLNRSPATAHGGST